MPAPIWLILRPWPQRGGRSPPARWRSTFFCERPARLLSMQRDRADTGPSRQLRGMLRREPRRAVLPVPGEISRSPPPPSSGGSRLLSDRASQGTGTPASQVCRRTRYDEQIMPKTISTGEKAGAKVRNVPSCRAVRSWQGVPICSCPIVSLVRCSRIPDGCITRSGRALRISKVAHFAHLLPRR
jgi:hypothetical protein